MPLPAIGQLAPNFDLTSTEDVVLMLRDEVPRTAVLLYLFADPADEATRGDLVGLARRQAEVKELSVAVLGISPVKLDELKAVQRELGLRFPLLTDDRGFSKHYGVEAGEGEAGPPALVLVDRLQRIRWIACPSPPVDEAWLELSGALKGLGSSASNYPRRITNWLVDRWVNQTSGLRKKRA